jgi:hypothetical protein
MDMDKGGDGDGDRDDAEERNSLGLDFDDVAEDVLWISCCLDLWIAVAVAVIDPVGFDVDISTPVDLDPMMMMMMMMDASEVQEVHPGVEHVEVQSCRNLHLE